MRLRASEAEVSYWPLRYTHTVKHPRQFFIWRDIIQGDWVFWALATAWLSSSPLLHIAAVGLLLLSFWCIYEQGYVENDRAAADREGNGGKVPTAHGMGCSNQILAWCWSVSLMVPALWLFQLSGSLLQAQWVDVAAAWVALLLFTRALFWVFNQLAPSSRTLVYPLLSGCRSFAPAAVLAIGPAGMLLLAANTIARSIPYYVYRALPPQHWPELPVHFMRAAVFVLLILAFEGARRMPELLFTPEVATMVVWCILRARREIANSFKNCRLLPSVARDRGGEGSPESLL